MAILAALNLAAVQRLKRTWQLLPDSILATLHSLETLMTTSNNYSVYRHTLKRINRKLPCVPYLGLYLKDLVFINDGNPRTLADGRVNFRKIWLFFDTLRDVNQYKRRRNDGDNHSYLYKQLKNNLPSYNRESDNITYNNSLKIEPRNTSAAS